MHVHHGLHPDADAWAKHCRQACDERGLSLEVRQVKVRAYGEGPEAAARSERYGALAAGLGSGEVLATAHHADDQAETVLMRLLRGGGTRGAVAMAPLQAFASGWLWRPLLQIPRQEVERHCRAYGLAWVDDPQNVDGSNLRSRLRPALSDLMAEVPGAVVALGRFAAQTQAQERVVDRLAGLRLARFVDDGRLAVEALEGEAPPVRAALWRRWCASLGLPRPGEAWIGEAERSVLAAACDRQPRLALGDCQLRRFRDRLCFLEALPPVPAGWAVSWDGTAPLPLAGGAGTLVAGAAPSRVLQVTMAPAGAMLRAPGAPHRRRLKHWFQARGVPPWERVRTPLLSIDGCAVQLGDEALHDATELLGDCRIRWQRPRWHRGVVTDLKI